MKLNLAAMVVAGQIKVLLPGDKVEASLKDIFTFVDRNNSGRMTV